MENRSSVAGYWVLVGFVGFVALTGGASRADALSLILLRPAAAILLGFACWSITREQVREFRWPLLILAAASIAILVQLIPLPPAVWGALPGRGLVKQVDGLAGLGPIWRPLTLEPSGTWNALFSMLVPIAVMLMVAQQSTARRHRLLPVLIVIGLGSGLLGLLQIIGSSQSPLYLYRVTNNGAAVGLFANRNHQAVLLACLFPMLATYAGLSTAADGPRFRHWDVRLLLCIGAAIVLLPLIIVTGSRLGLVVGLLGLFSAPLLYFAARPRRRSGQGSRRGVAVAYIAGAVAVVALTGLTLWAARGVAVDRLMASGSDSEVRLSAWRTTLDLIGQYFPFGSGYGSFIEIYQVAEPDAQLKPTFLNHAHNDLLEVALTGGILGIVLMVVAAAAWAVASLRAFRGLSRSRDAIYARLGAVIFLLVAVASISDYPMRIPLIATLLAIAAGWLAAVPAKLDGGE